MSNAAWREESPACRGLGLARQPCSPPIFSKGQGQKVQNQQRRRGGSQGAPWTPSSRLSRGGHRPALPQIPPSCPRLALSATPPLGRGLQRLPQPRGGILKVGAVVGVLPKQGSGMRHVPPIPAQTGQLTATNTRFRAPNPCPAALQAPHPSYHHSLPSSRLRLLPQELLFFPYLRLLYQEPFSPFIIVSLPSSPWGRLHL